MTDVAKAAGVSQSTVSMVLNDVAGSRLSAETRISVLRMAAELGYRLPGRQFGAASVAARRSLIGYLVDEISTSPHPVVSVDGARDAAWEHDCVVTVLVTRGNAEQEAAAIASLRANPALLGIVYSTIFTRQVNVPAALLGIPTVLLNCHDDSDEVVTGKEHRLRSCDQAHGERGNSYDGCQQGGAGKGALGHVTKGK